MHLTFRNFGFLLKNVFGLFSKRFETHASALNLTLTQCRVLASLQRNEGVSQVRLAELTGTDPMTLVRILDRMERDGWVERRLDPRDRRARQIYLLQTGLSVLDRMWFLGDQVADEAMVGFSADERRQFVDMLIRMQNNLGGAPLPDAHPEAAETGR